MDNLIANELIKLINNNQKKKARDILIEKNIVDIAEILDSLDDAYLIVLFRILPKNIAADVFAYMDIDSQQQIIEQMSNKEVAEILDDLFIDDAVDFIEEMPANVVKKVIQNTSADKRKIINKLLSYPEDSAGSIMTTEYISLKMDLTVEEAIIKVKQMGFDSETINTLYVVDKNRLLIGLLEIRQLILASNDTKLKTIMDTNVIYCQTTDDQEKVANQFTKYGFITMPVVDNEKRLVGIVTVDDILEVIEEEKEEDFAIMNALAPSDESYLDSSILNHAKKRIYWLLFLMISATFSGIIIRKYENVLSNVVILASFIPMLMDTGGNAGSQASTLIIRGLALDEISTKDYLKVIWKELRISLLVGSCLSLINFCRLYFFEKVTLNVSITVCLSLIFTVIIAKVVGGLLPLVAKKLKQDPAIMAGPLITTVVDVLSLIIYFTFATYLVLN